MAISKGEIRAVIVLVPAEGRPGTLTGIRSNEEDAVIDAERMLVDEHPGPARRRLHELREFVFVVRVGGGQVRTTDVHNVNVKPKAD